MTKYVPFNSIYFPDFQVVEQRIENIRLFPHTDQLSKLLKALKYDFEKCLPDRICRVDHRAKDYMKLKKFAAARVFCSHFNRARTDGLRLFALTDRNLVPRISIVQQITEHTEMGPVCRFKFYGGDDFFQEVYVNGRQVSFAGHVIKRFSERVSNPIGTDLTNFLCSFFGSGLVVMECNKRPAFVVGCAGSLLAFPVRLFESELFLPTCLTVKEINKLGLYLPPIAYSHTYDRPYRMPDIRNWNPLLAQITFLKVWEKKEPMRFIANEVPDAPWAKVAHRIEDATEDQGEGARIVFRDNIPGFGNILLRPGESEICYCPVEDLKWIRPDIDWSQAIPEHRASFPVLYGST